MISVKPPRARSSARVTTPSDKTPSMQTKTYVAPVGGWVTNTSLAGQDQQTAVVLENFWPTPSGIEPRAGSKRRVSIGGGVAALFEYQGGPTPEFFAADQAGIYAFDQSTADGTVLSEVVTGQTSGEYVTLEVQNDGGSFLTAVNGSDAAQLYNGSTWAPLPVTGVDTARLSHVWAYNNRTFFVEQGTLNAWYLGINSIQGAAEKLPLSGVFNRGGSLLFGATWSGDSGDGMDDRCVFVTDQGEFAVFSGDPASAATWSKSGVYDLGEPLGPNAVLKVGGDLIVATKAGLVPISAATQKDVMQLKLAALSWPIEPDWRRAVALAGNTGAWHVEKWDAMNMVLVAPPVSSLETPFCFAANIETGKWTKFTGWSGNAMKTLGGAVYFGTSAGDVVQCGVGGTDSGELIVCRACLAFDHLGAPGAFKLAQSVRGTFHHDADYVAQFSVGVDYQDRFPPAPNSAVNADGNDGSWDVSDWDATDWGTFGDSRRISDDWHDVSGQGRALAVQLQMTSGSSARLNCELVSVDLTFSVGDVVS